MDLFEAIENRRSIRRYQEDQPVDEAIVERLLRAAVAAPTAGNAQPWHFLVVRSATSRRDLSAAALGQDLLVQAPVVIVVCADLDRANRAYGSRGESLYCLQDTAAAVQNLLLAATAEGLGTCWVGAFDEKQASRSLALDAHLRPVALVPVGHPAERPAARPRRDLQEVTSHR